MAAKEVRFSEDVRSRMYRRRSLSLSAMKRPASAASGFAFFFPAFCRRNCMSSKETVKWEDGNEYPVIKLDITSHSHPFYTGKQKTLDVGGRVDKFRQRYGKK